ncbi:MAG TPA: bifunctional DNA-binding transcriptional regulator/O6-methylguanine-DNA methyltransferase Ada [Symbiobacteriaceae bacterium]|jgi:AraC family transcriptional regulator of adaptative response/methylated-DNA-[protein]-cysteine methyltransferase
MVEQPYPDAESQWAAVVNRDAAADGQFFYAVKSTGVYCRPACPARRPNRANVVFFTSPDLAEGAGFRPCLRCRPKDVSAQQRLVTQVQHLLDTIEPAPGLAALGEAVGMSPQHLQRLFKRATGLSPREYAAGRRAERLKVGLRQGACVTTALYDAGYGSVRALYDQAHAHLGMSPGAYKRGGRGVAIRYTFGDTGLGRMLLAATPRGVCALRFGDPEALLAELRAEFPQATLTEEPHALAESVAAVCAYLQGEGGQSALDLPLDVTATGFQQKVWNALRTIPRGETRSYKDVAELIGEPRAVRAVARACAANPVALVVPCHRVVRAGGEPGGYRWGVERKRRLLEQEKRG